MMARRGIPTTLIIGAQTERGFEAHAWVERRGLPLLSPGSDYVRLVEL
jgi:Transglutaminase-like superfamily